MGRPVEPPQGLPKVDQERLAGLLRKLSLDFD